MIVYIEFYKTKKTQHLTLNYTFVRDIKVKIKEH